MKKQNTSFRDFDDLTEEEKNKIKSGEAFKFSTICNECFRECAIIDFKKGWLHKKECSRYQRETTNPTPEPGNG